ncbi:hypothetical protein EZV62_002759 [Acer yangbiense]|uniref:Uncharacterized protein n=1 Tax=Acer yangbiense TaxID=1000413 RepID=A0A5C7IY67_9ROSI|nr:hypothetical protein EZV62_002759 [Acer yangbiense]
MHLEVHIVYMGALPAGDYSPSSHHFRFSGFFMKLLRAVHQRMFWLEAIRGASMNLLDGVVSVFPSKTFQLQSTRSWDFMGFSETVKRNVLLKAISLLVFLIMESGLNQRCLEGWSSPKKWKGDFAYDSVAIGAFHAMEKGILTTAPANQHRHQRLCHGYCQYIEAFRPGAVGAIQLAQESFPIPTVSLRNHDFPRVKLYLNSRVRHQSCWCGTLQKKLNLCSCSYAAGAALCRRSLSIT